jgi:hypothetical protein
MNMKKGSMIIAYVGLSILGGYASADKGVIVEKVLKSEDELLAIQSYWTPERMRAATPRFRGVNMSLEAVRSTAPESMWEMKPLNEDAIPGYAPGWAPGPGPQPDAKSRIEITPGDSLYTLLKVGAQPRTFAPFPPPSFPADYANYAPFNRWTWRGDSRIEETPTGDKIRIGYKTYPISTVGKLFLTLHGQKFVCSASVIQRNTIATAGHCVSDGAGTLATDFLFCPSYTVDEGGNGIPDPAMGCWAGITPSTTAAFHNSSVIDRDIACIVTAKTGTVQNLPVGEVTGWTGRLWNLPSRLPTFALGYPAGPPFPGHHIIVSASSEWYEVDMSSDDGQLSKYIGNDMTGGSSGGPWWISMRGTKSSGDPFNPGDYPEYPDVDGSDITDPFQEAEEGPFLNGVNSHSRCIAEGCPQGSVFLSETGSPQFRNTEGDDEESEDVFQACFDRGGI